jgi:hypothetical protein
MIRRAGLALLAIALLLAVMPPARADTATIEIRFLAMQEAVDLARGQLSPDGRVMALASRRLLVVDDDADHVAAVRALIRRLDVPAQTLQVQLRMAAAAHAEAAHLLVQGVAMPGGWVRLSVGQAGLDTHEEGMYMLRLVSGGRGRIEAGTIRPVETETRQWLAAHGIGQATTVTLVPVTAGFSVTARLAGDLAHLRLHPWLQQMQSGEGERPVIDIADADTELDVPLGQWVTIGAVQSSARAFGRALLSGCQGDAGRELLIRVRVDALP